MEYYCLGKNQASETFCSKFIKCQSSYQLQNLEILSTLWGHKNPCGQNFWNLFFFTSKDKIIDISRKKIKLGSHHLDTLKKTTLWPLFMDGVQLPQGYSHFEEAVYFLPLSSQKFLVLILSTSGG